jgi:5-formyltetrahydrofolate cyclo-ligase
MTFQGTDAVAAKAALRERMKAWRSRLPQHERVAASAAVAGHVVKLLAMKPAGIVGATLAMAEELDPAPAAAGLAARGWVVSLAVMQGRTAPLLFRRVDPATTFVVRVWGIPEPSSDAPTVVPDVLLIPLLAFDATGARLGYGGGFYDRTLASLGAAGNPPLTIGLAFDGQRIDAVPTTDYDQRLNHIITPAGVLTPAA